MQDIRSPSVLSKGINTDLSRKIEAIISDPVPPRPINCGAKFLLTVSAMVAPLFLIHFDFADAFSIAKTNPVVETMSG